jgi:hypothetical protein
MPYDDMRRENYPGMGTTSDTVRQRRYSEGTRDAYSSAMARTFGAVRNDDDRNETRALERDERNYARGRRGRLMRMMFPRAKRNGKRNASR